MSKSYWINAMFLFLLTACASGPQFTSVAPLEPKDGEARIYIYRTNAEPKLWGATIDIDGHEVTTLRQNGFTQAYLSPGLHTVSASWAALSGQRDSEMKFNAAADQTYFIVLLASSHVASSDEVAAAKDNNRLYDGGGPMYITLGSALRLTSRDDAAAGLANCKYEPSEAQIY